MATAQRVTRKQPPQRMPEKKTAAPAALKARVERLEATLEQAVWYIAELQTVCKAMAVQMAMEKIKPALAQQAAEQQAQAQQLIAEQLKTNGFAGVTGK